MLDTKKNRENGRILEQETKNQEHTTWNSEPNI